MKRQVLNAWCITLLTVFTTFTRHATLTHNDFYPLYSTQWPYAFMNENFKAIEKKMTDRRLHERVKITISPFVQKASKSYDTEKNETYLGDVHGPWNMIGLTYGSTPAGQAFTATLQNAINNATYQDGQPITNADYSDTNQNLGFLSVPLKYQKIGMRIGAEARILEDFVLFVQGGFSQIKQTAGINASDAGATATVTSTTNGLGPVVPIGSFINRELRQHYTAGTPPTASSRVVQLQDYYGTSTPGGGITSVEPDITTIENALIQKYQTIFNELGINIGDFNETGPEDISVGAVWRHNFFLNVNDAQEYAPFIMTPFLGITASVAIGKEQDVTKAFSVPFGNNGHHAISIDTGFSMDFYETIEIAWQAGATHFFKRDIAGLFVPTHDLQEGIYPFRTNVTVEPGKTWYFSLGMNAYHFIDKLSFFSQYLFVTHSKDTHTLIKADTAFKPERLNTDSIWKVQAMNLGLHYDFSPHLSFGALWQAPLAQRSAYKTNSIMLSMALVF